MNGVDIVFLLIFLTVGGLLLYGRVIKPAIYSSAKKKTANLCSYYSGTLKLLKRDPELSAVLTVDEDKLKNADVATIKSIFNGNATYGSQIAEKANSISKDTEMSTTIYGNDASTSSALSSLYNQFV